MNLDAALERSRSGQGAHVWLFFAEAIAASVARKLGAAILTKTMELHPDLGLDSYDQFFPNQDTLPRGGFGNLIALPLQKAARKNNNSVFVDEQLKVIYDQWAYLASIKKISRARVEFLVEQAEACGRVVGVRLYLDDEESLGSWRAPMLPQGLVELPAVLYLVISNEIFIEKKSLPPALLNSLIRIAAFQNPDFYRAQAMRVSVYGKPRIIGCAHDYPAHIGLPRGCLDEVLNLLQVLKVKYHVQEELCSSQFFAFKFQGELRMEQRLAAKALMETDMGVLSATTAFGKTVVAAWLIAARQVSTLVMVHTTQLQDQWVERLQGFLGVSVDQIGRLGGGRKKLTGKLDVALIQSLVKHRDLKSLLSAYSYVIVDECHHIPSLSFDHVISQVKARFITGLSATLNRKDGHHPIIMMRCGAIKYNVNAKAQAAVRPFTHHVIVRSTDFKPAKTLNENLRIQFQELYAELVSDVDRNQMICKDIIESLKNSRSPLILTERNEHLDILYKLLHTKVQHLIVLRGGMGAKDMKVALAQLKSNSQERVVLATGKFVGEGFDDARLDTLFITMPISWKGTIAQYIGRLHRLYDLKKEVQVYDYVDLAVPMLERMFRRRHSAYEAAGYKLQY